MPTPPNLVRIKESRSVCSTAVVQPLSAVEWQSLVANYTQSGPQVPANIRSGSLTYLDLEKMSTLKTLSPTFEVKNGIKIFKGSSSILAKKLRKIEMYSNFLDLRLKIWVNRLSLLLVPVKMSGSRSSSNPDPNFYPDQGVPPPGCIQLHSP